MAEYSRKAHGTILVTSNGKLFVPTPFIPDFIQVWDISRWGAPVTQNNPYIMWNKFMVPGDGLSIIYNLSLVPSLSMNYASAYPNGITPVIEGKELEYGPAMQITGITKANPAVVSTTVPHNLYTGDVVILEGLNQSASTGMQQIAGIPFAITRTGSSAFSINWNTNQSNYTALSGSPSGCVYRAVKNPYIYSPGNNFISAITTGATTTIQTTGFHNLYVGQEISFRIPAPWGTVQLNSSRSRGIPGNPLYGVVTSVNNNQSVTVNIDSSTYAPFNSNIAFAKYSGLSYAQMVTVGDYNMGGAPLSTNNGQLYPSSFVNPASVVVSPNGPGILGAFSNYSRFGFTIGTAFAPAQGTYIYWEASLHDISTGVQLGVI